MHEQWQKGIGIAASVALLGLSGCGPVDDDADDGGTNGGSADCSEASTFSDAYGSEVESEVTISANSCVRVEQDIAVAGSEAALNISEGVTLEFAENTGLEVYNSAALVVDGTADSKVTFTGTTQQKGWWGGIAIWDSTRSANKIKHAVIEYGGNTNWSTPKSAKPSNLQLKKGGHGSNGPLDLAVEQTTIRHSAARGMYVRETVDLTSFDGNEFTDNADEDASVHPANVGDLRSSSTWSSPVVIRNGELQGSQPTWPALEVPYRVTGNLAVLGEETELTIAGGGTYKFTEGKGLEVYNSAIFVVDGSSDSKVTFTGTSEEKGWWGGIAIWDSARSANRITHAIIEYAGDPDWSAPKNAQPSNLQLKKGGHGSNGPLDLAVEQTTIRQSATLGMHARSSVDLSSFDGNTFSDNAEAAASIHPENIDNLGTSTTWNSPVDVRSGELTGEQVTWPALEVSYHIQGDIAVLGEETQLTVAAGGTYEFTENTGMEVYDNAALVVDGASDNKVTFTGTTREKGWWGGIAIWNSTRSANRITHATISHGGDPNWTTPKSRQPSLLELKKGGHGSNGPLEIALQTVALESSETAGMHVHESTTLTECNVTFADNNTDIIASNDETQTSASNQCGG